MNFVSTAMLPTSAKTPSERPRVKTFRNSRHNRNLFLHLIPGKSPVSAGAAAASSKFCRRRPLRPPR